MIKTMRLTSCLAVAALAVCAWGAAQSHANDYPKRPVTIIVPAGAGASPDVITRLVAERLSQAWGQQAVVSNRPGGGGVIAAQAMAGVESDGYTLFMPLASTLTVMTELQPKLPIDLDRDLVPVGLLGVQPMMIAVHSSLSINSLQELVARGRNRPTDLLIGAQRGTIPHIAWEMFRRRAEIDATFVPYPSIARAVQDAIGGTINLIVDSPAGLAAAIQTGALKPLAVFASDPLPGYRDVPTVAASMPSLGAFEAGGWFALMAPRGTPETVLSKLGADLRSVLSQNELQQQYQALGTYVRVLSATETGDFIRTERDRWRPIVRQVGVSQ